MRTKSGRPRCAAHLWSDSFDLTISGNDHVQFNVMQCAWTGRGGVKWDLSPLLAHRLWVSLRPVKLIKMFRCGRFFPHLRPARWTRSMLWNGNPVSDHDIKQLVTFGACQKQPAVQQALLQPVSEEEFSQILANLSKALQVLDAILESLQLWQGHECCKVWHASFLALKGV